MEGLEYWDKMNDKAQAINKDLQAMGKKPLPPLWVFPRLLEHLKLMGMNVLTQAELDTGYGDPDQLIKDRLSQCIKDWDMESKRVAKEKKAAFEKRYHAKRTAEKNDTTPGLEPSGGGAPMFHNVVMPTFPLSLGQVLAQRTRYSEIHVLEPGSTFLRADMSDGEITERVISLHSQIFDLIHDLKSVTSESWGRLSVFGLQLDLRFLHQFLEANVGTN